MLKTLVFPYAFSLFNKDIEQKSVIVARRDIVDSKTKISIETLPSEIIKTLDLENAGTPAEHNK